MKKTPVVLLITSSVLLLVFACSKKDNTVTPPALDCNTITNKAFAADINPIIQSTCAISSCHASGSINGPGPLTTYFQISSASASIRSAVASGRMPQSGTLSTGQKNSILCWIDSGAPNN